MISIVVTDLADRYAHTWTKIGIHSELNLCIGSEDYRKIHQY